MTARPQPQRSWTRWILAGILLFATLTRLWRLNFPSTYYFDEVYHVVTSKLVAKNDPAAYEWWHTPPEPGTAIDWLHPPLAKLMQGASITLLGNTSFAWRISSAVMGVATVALVYSLGKRLRFSDETSLIAAFLLSLDGLALVVSRITMNDAHVTFFFALTVFFYLGWKKSPTTKTAFLTALTAGLATASKWSGVFVVGFMFVDLVREHCKLQRVEEITFSASARLLVLTVLLVPVIYLSSYGQMFLQGKGFSHLKQLHQQIWWYQTGLKATHPYQSKPWQWVLNLRPVYAYTNATEDENTMQNIYLQGNPLFLWAGAFAALWIAIDCVGSAGMKLNLLRRVLHERSKVSAESLRTAWEKLNNALPLLESQSLLLLAYVSPWILWSFSPRIMFFYHYAPAGPFLALMLASLLGAGWHHKGLARTLSVTILTAIAITFFVFYPNWTGIEVATKPFAQMYFALPSWR